MAISFNEMMELVVRGFEVGGEAILVLGRWPRSLRPLSPTSRWQASL